MAKVFISYSRQSGTVAASLAGDVEALGHTVWLDKELSGGQSWWDRILSTIRDRDAVLRLARAFTSVPPPRSLPDPLPPTPEVPLSYLGGLGERVDRASTLTYEEQSALIVDLRRSTRDPETRNDALTLLRRMRKRRDLLAAVADEIDEALRSSRSAAQDSRVVGGHVPPAQDRPNSSDKMLASQVDIPERLAPAQKRPKISAVARLKGACTGAVVGVVLVAISILVGGTLGTRQALIDLSLGFGGIPWALGGAIAGMRLRVIGVAMLTGGAGFILGLGITSGKSESVVTAMILGAGLGQLVGAVAGALWCREKRSIASPAGP